MAMVTCKGCGQVHESTLVRCPPVAERVAVPAKLVRGGDVTLLKRDKKKHREYMQKWREGDKAKREAERRLLAELRAKGVVK